MRRLFWAFTALVLGIAVLLLWRLEDHDLGPWPGMPLEFAGVDGPVAGTLWLPEGMPWATVLLVHGDGPQDRTSGGGYAPLISALLDAGLAVGSWDKPGMGASDGNWLAQSMDDRAEEVRRALAAVPGRGPVGVMGFSQAGWVLPKLAPGTADFLVLVGPAVNWSAQGQYYTRRRLEAEGAGAEAIARELEEQARRDALLFGGEPPGADVVAASALEAARFAFVRRNHASDVREDLATLSLPLLAVWGAEDLNVDAEADAAVFGSYIGNRHPMNETRMVPRATHGLLKAGPYNYQRVDMWPATAKARFFLEGRYAYAPGAIDGIVAWIREIRANWQP